MLSYASYFISFLLNNITNIENIEKIIFFGSASRNESDKESDIDIFIEVKKKNQKFEKEIKEVTENFYESREAALFKSKGIENTFDVKVGLLKEWKDLYKSIASTGIILYGKYEAKEFNKMDSIIKSIEKLEREDMYDLRKESALEKHAEKYLDEMKAAGAI